MVKNVSFELRKGNLRLLRSYGCWSYRNCKSYFGADEKIVEKFISTQKVEINSPEDAVKNGIGYLSEDRRRFGIVVEKTVAENVTMATLENYMSGSFINEEAERKEAENYIEQLSVKTPSPYQKVSNLSEEISKR